VSNSTTSKSSTSVSANSTNVRVSRLSLDIMLSLPGRLARPHGAAAAVRVPGSGSSESPAQVVRRSSEAERSAHHRFGHFGEEAVVGEGMGAQPGESLAHTDAELDGHHPRGLVDDEAEVGSVFQFGGEVSGC